MHDVRGLCAETLAYHMRSYKLQPIWWLQCVKNYRVLEGVLNSMIEVH